MRLLVLFLVGLFVGAAGAVLAVNALNRGPHYDKAIMTVMGQQMKAMDRSIKANRCAAADLTPRLQTLRFVANDIEPAFSEVQEPQFGRYAGDLRAAADAGLLATPASCAAAGATLARLDKACDACHRDFRN
jgi:cytochrome c556